MTTTLPALTKWRIAGGSPEAQPGFNDRSWQAIDGRRGGTITAWADGQPALTMDPYGFHEGDAWYRGRFEGGPEAEKLAVFYGGGGAGMLQLWLVHAVERGGEAFGQVIPDRHIQLAERLVDDRQGTHAVAGRGDHVVVAPL